MEYAAEPFAGNDLSSLAGLHSHLVPMARGGNLRYLQWKYLENPYIQSPQIAIARSGGEIVAMRGLLGGAWQRSPGSELEVIPYVDDLIVHPDHRNRGLFVLLNRQTIAMAGESGFPALLSVSGGPATQSLSIATGWKEVRELERAYRVRPGSKGSQRPGASRLKSKARGAARKLKYQPIARISRTHLDKALRPVAAQDSRITVSAEPRVEAMSNLASVVGRHTSSRTTDYLQWRLRNPDRTYRFVYWNDPVPQGYLILAWTGTDPERAMIIDHCAVNDSVFRDLMAAASGIRAGSIELMSSTLSEDRLRIVRQLEFGDDPDYVLGTQRRFLLYAIEGANSDTEPSISSAAATWRVDLIDTMQG